MAAALFVLLPMLTTHGGSVFWLMVIVGGIAGYVGPSMYIDQRIKTRKARAPLRLSRISWICWWSAPTPGFSMEAALERVGRELGDSYPSLSANIHMTNLEIRAGRTLKDALEHFAERLAWRRRAPSRR